jgi:hypothetical protein
VNSNNERHAPKYTGSNKVARTYNDVTNAYKSALAQLRDDLRRRYKGQPFACDLLRIHDDEQLRESVFAPHVMLVNIVWE